MKPKLLILGGSSPYMLLLFRALSQDGLWQRLGGLCLFGRDRRRLDWLAAVANLQSAGCPVQAHTDYARCLAEAPDLVFNQIRFGGMATRARDEALALECGLPADETLGAVGLSNALRTLAGMRPLVEPLQGRSHRPRWINFTNPCSVVTQYLVETLGTQNLGLCDYPVVFRQRIARFLQVDPARLEIDYFGLNHMAFVHGLRLDGQPKLPELLAQAARFEPLLPTQARHPVLLVPSWSFVFDPVGLHARQRVQAQRAALLLDLEQQCQHLLEQGETDPAAHLSLLAQRDCAWYELAVTPLLALCLGAGPGEAIVNGDAGDVFGLGPRPCVVETHARIDAQGMQVRPIPAALRDLAVFGHCRQAKRAELLLLDSVLQHDPDRLQLACELHPMWRPRAALHRYLAALAARDPLLAQALGPTTIEPISS